MKSSVNFLDLSPLSDSARREVANFYQFVMQRQGRVEKKRVQSRKKLPAEFYKPITVPRYLTVSRDEIYNDV